MSRVVLFVVLLLTAQVGFGDTGWLDEVVRTIQSNPENLGAVVPIKQFQAAKGLMDAAEQNRPLTISEFQKLNQVFEITPVDLFQFHLVELMDAHIQAQMLIELNAAKIVRDADLQTIARLIYVRADALTDLYGVFERMEFYLPKAALIEETLDLKRTKATVINHKLRSWIERVEEEEGLIYKDYRSFYLDPLKAKVLAYPFSDISIKQFILQDFIEINKGFASTMLLVSGGYLVELLHKEKFQRKGMYEALFLEHLKKQVSVDDMVTLAALERLLLVPFMLEVEEGYGLRDFVGSDMWLSVILEDIDRMNTHGSPKLISQFDELTLESGTGFQLGVSQIFRVRENMSHQFGEDVVDLYIRYWSGCAGSGL